MCPQFVDFDADGHRDIITATYEGVAFVVPGGKAGYLKPERLVDRHGDNVQLSQYYDFENNSWENTDRGMPKGRKDHCVSAAAFDWDADGDLDLLLGAYGGRLFLRRNEGTAREPQFVQDNVPVMAGGKPLRIRGGMTAPRLVDWDGDGLTDLVCGGFEGGVFLFRNAGKAGAPEFEASRTLIQKAKNGPGLPRAPEEGCYADPVDYDGDGDLDLLVGGYARWTPQARELNDAEQALLGELDEAMRTLEDQMDEMFERAQKDVAELGDDPDPEEVQQVYDQIFESEDFRALDSKMRELRTRIEELRPSPKREASIWLYRRTG